MLLLLLLLLLLMVPATSAAVAAAAANRMLRVGLEGFMTPHKATGLNRASAGASAGGRQNVEVADSFVLVSTPIINSANFNTCIIHTHARACSHVVDTHE